MYTPSFNKPRVYSVSQVNYYIKSLLDNDPHLSTIFMTGEISNLKDHYSSGHIYLSLKDGRSVINAVMFAGNARGLRFRPTNGMKVICRGHVGVYEPSGQYQLYIEAMQPDGVGELAIAFEQLKNSLAAKGLFEQSHKKPLPKFPKTVGVITSPTGAAVQDIRNILFRRFPGVNILMCPVLVQGDGAPAQLVRAVKRLGAYRLCDVIIIGRGGGSAEDLWAFNSEELAYAIYECPIPVISAVGHETDFTICDFVADLRAPTPSAAAELAVPDKAKLRAYYESQLRYVRYAMDSRLRRAANLDLNLRRRLHAASPQARIARYTDRYATCTAVMDKLLSQNVSSKEGALKAMAAKLDGLSPFAVLSRGYSIAEKDGEIISSKTQLKPGDDFTLRLSDGTVKATAVGE